MNMQLASLKVFCNRNLVVEIGKYLDLRELPALLINKSVREFLLEPRYWRLQACVLGISQLPRDPRFYYEAVKTHAEKRDLKASIGGCLDRGGIKLDFGELEEVRKGIGKMLLQDVLPEFTYRQVLVLIRNNGDKIKPIIHLFYTSKVFEPILLFSNELSDRDRLQSISSACWEKRLDIIPQLRPDLLSNEARRELFLCYHCNKIQKELLESGSILPVPQADALSCLRKLHELKNYELIKQISQTLTSEARGKAILEFLPTIKREEDLEGIFIIFNSGNIDSPDQRAQIMQLACERGFESLIQRCFYMQWDVGFSNLGFLVVAVAKSGKINILNISRIELDQGTRGLAIAEAAKRGDDLMVARLLPEKMSEGDRAVCILGALENRHLKLALMLLRSGKIVERLREKVILKASEAGSHEIVSLLIEEGPIENCGACVQAAAMRGFIEVVEALLRGREISDRHASGAIRLAIENFVKGSSDFRIFKLLPLSRLSISTRGLVLLRALHYQNKALARMILASGPIPLDENDRGSTKGNERAAACMQAIQLHDIEILKELQPELLSDNDKGCLLANASLKNNLSAFQLIAALGPILTGYWKWAFKFARERGYSEILEELNKVTTKN